MWEFRVFLMGFEEKIVFHGSEQITKVSFFVRHPVKLYKNEIFPKYN